MKSWSQFWKNHPKNCVHTHWYLRTHATVSTSTSRCRHPMSTSRNACACKMSGLQRSWMSGRSVRRSLFSRSRIAEFTVQSSVSSQNSWHLKHGLNLYAFKLRFSKCSNFAHLKVLGTRRLRFLGGSFGRMRDQFWPSFHWSNLLLRLYFDNCLTLIQACVLIDLQLILHWVG